MLIKSNGDLTGGTTMRIETAKLRHIVETVSKRVIGCADELTALDQAIGDGDHGLNMKRGFEAVLADLDRISSLPLPEALGAIGTTLVMKVGGASGPLYGTLFMALGKAIPAEPARQDAIVAFGEAIAAVQARGKSFAGQKTMLDVLIPLHTMLLIGGLEDAGIRDNLQQNASATIPMLATRGRASFLGERSIGHMDPGARSSQILIEAVLDALEGKA